MNNPIINGQTNGTDRSQKKNHKWQIIHEKCSTALAIRKIQIKTTLGLHPTPVRMAVIKKTNNNKCW
jgi:hypothetical protein